MTKITLILFKYKLFKESRYLIQLWLKFRKIWKNSTHSHTKCCIFKEPFIYQEADFATHAAPGTHVGGISPKGLLYLFPHPPGTKATNKNACKLEYSSFLHKPIQQSIEQTNQLI